MPHKYRANIRAVTDLEQVISDSLELIEWWNHLSDDSTAFSKPNFTSPFYREVIATSSVLLRIRRGLFKDREKRIIVTESCGYNRSFTADRCYRCCRMPRICEETGPVLVDLSTIPDKKGRRLCWERGSGYYSRPCSSTESIASSPFPCSWSTS